MSKWKCEICGNEFENFHAQGFDRKIYCPLCYFKKENQELKEKLLVTQTNEETFRLEMEDITKILGIDENTLFDDVKAYVRSLKDNWNKLKVYIKTEIPEDVFIDTEWFVSILDKMQELEQGSDSNE